MEEKGKQVEIHLSIDMSAKALETMRSLNLSQYNNNILHVRLNGGEFDEATLISSFINKHFSSMYVYSIYSAGIIPFLLFHTWEKLYFSKYGRIYMHAGRVSLSNDQWNKMSEVEGLLKMAKSDINLMLNIFKTKAIPPVIKDNLQKALQGNEEFILEKEDLEHDYKIF